MNVVLCVCGEEKVREAHVTNAKPHVTVAKPHVTVAKPHVTVVKPHVTTFGESRFEKKIITMCITR